MVSPIPNKLIIEEGSGQGDVEAQLADAPTEPSYFDKKWTYEEYQVALKQPYE